ncbi:MAG TPA: sulfotransferase [Caulobacteraceae bacterium]|jgi:tetratricopeptide (TPR) repeat protein
MSRPQIVPQNEFHGQTSPRADQVATLVAEASAHRKAGQFPKTEEAARAALALEPGQAVALYELGVALHCQGRVDEAAAALEEACVRRPAYADAHYARGVALFDLGQVEAAATAFQRAVESEPGFLAAHTNAGLALRKLGRVREAEAAFVAAVTLAPRSAEQHYHLGLARRELGRMEAAAACFRQAIALQPDHAEAHFSLSLLTSPDDRSPAAEADFERLRREVERADTQPPLARSALLYAMAKALEDRGDYNGAFHRLNEANRLARDLTPAGDAPTAHELAEIGPVFDRSLMSRLDGAGARSRRPIFIVGMPRSGSTLVEQILSAHPDVAGGGELANLGQIVRHARGPDGAVFPFWARALDPDTCAELGDLYLSSLAPVAATAHITDKALFNFAYLGLIHLSLPGAAIIHCRRDPRDVAVSCFAGRFNDGLAFSYDLAELGRYWRAYDALMQHWRAVLPPGRMLEVPYEALVDDVEAWARRLLAHCGLDWDDACLRFHESDRPVLTSSMAQVRRPIYRSSVGRWRRFEAHLTPLFDALDE